MLNGPCQLYPTPKGSQPVFAHASGLRPVHGRTHHRSRKIAGRYSDKGSLVDVKIFEGKSHFICGEPGWEAVADHILDWSESLQAWRNG